MKIKPRQIAMCMLSLNPHPTYYVDWHNWWRHIALPEMSIETLKVMMELINPEYAPSLAWDICINIEKQDEFGWKTNGDFLVYQRSAKDHSERMTRSHYDDSMDQARYVDKIGT